MNEKPIIILACGGSGMEVSSRLIELMMEDTNWRSKARQSVFFIVADTEISKINGFVKTLPHSLQENVFPFPLSEGLATLNDIVNPALRAPYTANKGSGKPVFSKEDSREAFDRLYTHYWKRNTENLEPYRAAELEGAPISEGAGQRPVVSHTLAWYRLPEFEVIVRNVVESIHQRFLGNFDHLTIYSVGSLAGGTGRGCWRLLTWKIREVVKTEIHGIRANYLGYFFDSTVFESVEKKRRSQLVAMRTNTFTGLSEQSACMNGDFRNANYMLPRLSEPKHVTESENDVIVMPEGGVDPDFFKAVDKFFVITGTPHLPAKKPGPFYTLAANALFARLSYYSIGGQDINDANKPLLGVHCGSLEVNAQHLRLFFENASRTIYLREMLRIRDEVVNDSLRKMLKEQGLDFSVPRSRDELIANPKGNILERILAHLDAQVEDELKTQIGTEHEEGELNSSEEAAIDAIQDVIEVKKRAVSNAVDAVLGSIDLEESIQAFFQYDVIGLDRPVEDTVEKAVVPEPEDDDASPLRKPLRRVAEAGEVARRALVHLFGEKTGVFQAFPRADDLRFGDEPELVDYIREKRGRSAVFVGLRYDSVERAEILQRTRKEMALNALDMIVLILPNKLYNALKCLQTLDANATKLNKLFDGVKLSWTDDLKERLGAGREDEIFGKVFSDPRRPDTFVPEDDDKTARFYRRSLRPPLAPEQVAELVLGGTEGGESGEMAFSVFEDKMDDFIKDNIFSRKFSVTTSKLESVVRESVVVRSEFLIEEFSLVGVLERVETAWIEILNGAVGDQDRLDKLEDMYVRYFGALPPKRGNRYEPHADFGVLKHTLLGLAETCRPTLNLRADVNRDDNCVTIILPDTEYRGFSLAKVQQEANKRMRNCNVDVARPQQGESRSSFAAFVYSSWGVESMDEVASFDHWKQSAEVTKQLKIAEEAGGQAMFKAGDLTGVGYIDPFFVRNDYARALRWKPWIPEGGTPEEVEALEALHYALLHVAPEGVTWPLPLVQEGKQRYFYLNRKPVELSGGVAKAKRVSPWSLRGKDQKAAIGQGIDAVLEALTSDHPEWRKEILSEASIFWEDVASPEGIAPKSKAYEAVLQSQLDYLHEEQKRTKDQPEQYAVWTKLYEHVEAKLK